MIPMPGDKIKRERDCRPHSRSWEAAAALISIAAGISLYVWAAVAAAVGGEFPIKRQSGSGTELGNAAAKRDSQARQEQV